MSSLESVAYVFLHQLHTSTYFTLNYNKDDVIVVFYNKSKNYKEAIYFMGTVML